MNYLWNPDAEFKKKMDAIMDVNVLDISVRHVITVDVNATLEQACKALSDAGIKKIPVMNEGHLAGILSRSSITHYLTKRYLAHHQTALK